MRVEVPTPALRDALPRMDIAVFVGFAAAGPVDLPVAVESLGEFEAVFGGEIVLARARSGGELGGLLHPCVRGFFSGGGRRCWIVRVAAPSAQTTLFPLADLLVARRADWRQPWRLQPALIAARSPGSWADGLTVATRLAARWVQVRPDDYDGSRLNVDVLGPAALALRTGDLLRFVVHGDRLLHTRIDELAAPVSEPGGRLRRRLRLRGMCVLSPQPGVSPSSVVSHLAYFEPTSNGGGSQVEHLVAAEGEWVEERLAVRCRLPVGRVPRRGAVLQVRFADAAPAWFQVIDSVLTEAGDAARTVGVEISGRLWNDDAGSGWLTALTDWIGDRRERPVQWVRLGLRVSDGRQPDFTLDGIGMAAPVDAPSADLGIASLPDDQRFFGPEGDAAGSDPVSNAFELTRRDSFGRLTRRFPLASLPAEGELMLIPLGGGQEFGPGLGAVGIDRLRLRTGRPRRLFLAPVRGAAARRVWQRHDRRSGGGAALPRREAGAASRDARGFRIRQHRRGGRAHPARHPGRRSPRLAGGGRPAARLDRTAAAGDDACTTERLRVQRLRADTARGARLRARQRP